MLDCPICGNDYSVIGLDQGRCRMCGGVVVWQDDDATDGNAAAGPLPSGLRPDQSIDAMPWPTEHDSSELSTPVTTPGNQADQADQADPQRPVESAKPGEADASEGSHPSSAPGKPVGASSDEGSPADESPEGTAQDPDTGPTAGDSTPFQTLFREPSPGDSFEARAAANMLSDSRMEELDSLWKHTYVAPVQPTSTLSQGNHPGAETKLVIQSRQISSIDDRQIQSGSFDYELLKVIGTGGVGVVYDARQSSIDRNVAVKMLRGELKDNREQCQKFLSEAVVTGELEHPNIIPIYDLGRNQSGELFYSMKYAHGTAWSELIGTMSLAENLETLMRVADAIAFAHDKSVIHRDIKPENVMLGQFGEVLVLDWGIAVSTAADFKSGIIGDTVLGGTPVYMAPEMATGPAKSIGYHSDVYLLGATLFEILTGLPPHAGETIRECLHAAASNEIRPTTIEGELMDIAMTAMSTQTKRRYQSVIEFQQAVRSYQSHSESIRLSDHAEQRMRAGREKGNYEDFAQAIYGFNEAMELWDGNAPARRWREEAKLAYAQLALENGDFDLGVSLLDRENARHRPVIARLESGKKERDERHQRLAKMRRSFNVLMFVLLFCATGAVIVFSQQANRLRQSQEVALQNATEAHENAEAAQQNAKQAQREKTAADQATRKAKRSAEIAERLRKEAMQAQARASRAADDARQQTALAEQNAYRLSMGLAPQQIAQNAFAKAREILQREAAAERRKLRHFEWGRLQYLATELDTALATSAGGATGTPIHCVDCVDDGSLIIAGSTSGHLFVWRKAADNSISRQTLQLAEPVNAVAISQGGDLLLVAYGDRGEVGLWQLKGAGPAGQGAPLARLGREPARVFQPHKQRINQLRFSPDQQHVLSCSDDQTGRIWSVRDGAEQHALRGHLGPVNDARFGPDGRWAVTASADGTVRVWSVRPGRPVAELDRFQGHAGAVHAATFVPGAGNLRVVSAGQQLLAWTSSAPAAVQIAQRLNEQPRNIFLESLVESIKQNTSEVATTTIEAPREELLPLLSWQREQVQYEGHESAVFDVNFSGNKLISAGQDGTLRVWDGALPQGVAADIAPRMAARKVLGGHGGMAREICVPSALAGEVISGSYDHSVRLWDIEAYTHVERYGAPTAGATASALSRDDRYLLVGHGDGTARLYDAKTRALLATLNEGHDYLAYTGLYYDGGQKMLTIGGDNRAIAWDVQRGAELRRMNNAGYRGVMALSSDEATVATGSEDNTAILWDTQTGERRAELIAAEIAARREQLRSQLAKQVDESDAAFAARLQQQMPDVSAIAFSPDDRLVAVGATTGECWICDAATGSTLTKFQPHTRTVNALDFIVDQDRQAILLTAGDDRSVGAFQVTPDAGGVSIQETPNSRMVHPRSVLLLRAVVTPGQGASIFTVCAQPRTGENKQRVMQVRHWKWGAFTAPEKMVTVNADRINALDIDVEQGGPEVLLTCVDGVNTSLREWDPSQDETPLLWSDGRSRGLVTSGRFGSTDADILTVGGSGARQWSRVLGRRLLSFRPHSAITAVGFVPPEIALQRQGVMRLALGQQPQPASTLLLYTASVDGSVKIWEARLEPGAEGAVAGEAASERATSLWRIEGVAAEDPNLRGHRGGINTASFLVLDGKPTLLTGSQDATAKQWIQNDAGEWIVARTFRGHTGAIHKLLPLPGRRSLLTVGADGEGFVWDLGAENQSPPRALAIDRERGVGHSGAILCATASSNGQWIATGGEDRTIQLWDATGAGPLPRVAYWAGHSQPVLDVQFSQDRRRLFSAGADEQLHVWDIDSLLTTESNAAIEALLSMTDHATSVTSISLSRSGRYLVTTGDDGVALGWNSVAIEPSLLVFGDFVSYDVASHPQRLVAEQAIVSAPTRYDFSGARLVVRMQNPDPSWAESLTVESVPDQIRIEAEKVSLWSANANRWIEVGQQQRGEGLLEIHLTQSVTPPLLETLLRHIQYQCAGTEIESDDTRIVEFGLLDETNQLIGNQAFEQRLIYLVAEEVVETARRPTADP